MKRILIILGLLLSNATIESVYNVGTIDSISGTNNGGTGYGNATQASAVGYVTAGFTDIMQLFGSAIQPDGKTVVAGWDATTGSAIVARYNINGTEDATFNPGPGFYVTFLPAGTTNAQANGVTVLPNGKIVVVGTLTVTSGSRTAFFAAQFLPNGALDTTGFGGGNGYVIQNITGSSADIANAVTVDSSGNIYVVGTSTQATFGNVFVAEYDSSGTLVTGYNSGAVVGGTGVGTTIAGIALLSILTTSLTGDGVGLDAYGNIVISGSAGSALLVGRFDATGILDTAGFNNPSGYNTQGSSSTVGYGVGFQSTGKIIVAGADSSNLLVLRYTTDGLLDSYANNPASPFGMGGAGFQTGYITSIFGGSFATAYGLAIQSDDTIVIGGTTVISGNQSLLVARYLADGSSLDTANFASPNGFTATYVASSDNANTFSMQQNGSFIAAGNYYNGSNAEFVTARYLGNIPQGCMDYTYNPAVASSPGTPGFKLYPTDTTATDKPQVTSLQALADNSVYVLTQNIAGTPACQLVQLSSTGTVAVTEVAIAQIGGTDVIVDSQQRAVVVGTNASAGWIARYKNVAGAMTIDTNFNGGSILVESVNSTSFRRVGEQKVGRLIVIGQLDTDGLVIAYTEGGVLATSSTSVPFGGGSFGFMTLPSYTFYDMVIDNHDGIYIIASDADGSIVVVKYLADGSDLDPDFGTLGILNPGLDTADYATPSISFDADGNIVIAAIGIAFSDIRLMKYDITGTTLVGSVSISQGTSLLTSPILTRLQCDTHNQILCAGYDTNEFFVGRMLADFTGLDIAFAPYSSCPGILKTMYSSINPTDSTTPARVANDVCISPNGSILFGGYENIDSTSTVSLVGQVVGDTTPYSQVARYPGETATGIIDVTFGTNGALDLFTSTTVPHGQPQVMHVLASNKILMADANGTNTILSQLTSSYALDTPSFGSTTGSITLTGLVTPTAIMVDATAANYYILGSNGAHGVVYKVNDTGTFGGTAFATTTLTSAHAITQQASGRILLAGYDITHSGGSGVIVAYTPAGTIDTSFNASSATPGYWYTGVAHPITSISVGATSNAQLDADKIFFAYQNGSSAAVVARLLENGTALDSNFTFGTAIASVSSDTQIKMQLDASGKIVLVANTGATAGIQAARYTSSGADNVGGITMIANASGQALENILTLSNGTTLILAAVPNATATSAFMTVAQLTTSFALDPEFNAADTPGYLTTNVPSSSFTPVMDDFYALDVISTGGILVSGDNSQTASIADAYLTKIVATAKPTKVSQSATSLGAAGTLDITLNPAGSTAGFMNLAEELQTTQFPSATTVRVLLENPNGTYYIAGSTSSNSYVTMMSDDDVQQTGFGTSGLLTLSGKTNLSAMLLAQNGGMFIIGGSGSSGSNAGWLQYVNTVNGNPIGGFSSPSGAGNVLDAHYAIAQQTNQRIIVAGEQAGTGALIAYNSVTGAVDTTFGVNGIYTATGYGAINSIVVDATDSIYFVVNEQGGAPDRGFIIGVNPSGSSIKFSPNNIITSSTVAANNHVVLDQAGNLTVVGVDTTDNTIVVKTCLSSNGAVTDSCTLTQTGAASVATGIVTPNVTDILVDLNASPGKVIVTGYDSSTSPSTPFVLRVQAAVSSGLDTTFNSGGGNPGVQTYDTLTSGITTNWYAGMINADGKITVAGYASALTTPYMMRVYGDDFIGQYSPSLTPLTAGTAGTIDTNFGASGEVLLAGLSGDLVGATAQIVVPNSTGQYYVGLQNAAGDASLLIRLTNGAVLDPTFNGTGFADGLVPVGISDLFIDGNGDLVAVGTDGFVWIARWHNDGSFDGTEPIPGASLATALIEQTLDRYVTAGQLIDNNHGALFAFTDTGAVDTTFGINGNGIYDSGVVGEIHDVISDVYDRLIIAYKNGSGIDLLRLTSNGLIDTTFGSAGIVTGAIAHADSVSQVRLAFDASGNIVLAAHINDGANKIAVKAYANTTGTTVVETELDIAGLTAPTLTNLIAVSDGTIVLSGYQSGANDMWVARVKNSAGAYVLDIVFASTDTIHGIMQFKFDTAGTVTGRALNSISIYGDGQIAMVGTETDSVNTPNISPFLSMAYNDPYTSQELFCQNSKPIGTNDTTLGASLATATGLGVTFFASASAAANSGQVARAIALQDDANIVIAVDGGASAGSSTPSDIFISMFGVDGLLNTGFNGTGYATVLSSYENQHVTDMVTFTTVAGVHKAILGGYATDATLGITGSLLLQYNLTTPGIDTANFGGFDGNLPGIAFGNGYKACVVGQQSSGRIVVGGLTQGGAGVLLGYTSIGKLDASFGIDGIQLSNTGATGIYAHVIDTQNRIVIAYNNAGKLEVARFLPDGSALDDTFGTAGLVTTNITGLQTGVNNNFKVVVDGSGNVIVAAITGDGTTSHIVTVYSYVPDGTSVNAINSFTAGTGFPGSTSSTFTIGRLLVDTQGNVIVVAYDSHPTPNTILVTQLVSALTLDPNFNGSGYLTYKVSTGSTQVVTDALIHPDGRILVVGSED